ncbi:MAG: hypothetical protein FJ096_12135 [Deltaproteobacteria bacterium]|nr:hypothetical protein [Deltaproteobacteria bacterium]
MRWCSLAVLVSGLSACAGTEFSGNLMSAAKPYVLGRAEKDLACPSKQIEVFREVGGRYVASGCGRSVRYQTTCEQLQCDVAREGERPAAWRDRPENPEFQR